MKQQFQYVPDDAVAHLRAGDELLAKAIDRVGPFTLEPRPAKSLFEALMRSIVYQQLHGKAASTIHGRVIAQLKAHGGATPEALTKVPDAALRSAGLSTNKLRAVRDLARKCLDGTVPTLREAHRLDDAELVERLTEVRGIGPWTVPHAAHFLPRPARRSADGRLRRSAPRSSASTTSARDPTARGHHSPRAPLAAVSFRRVVVSVALAGYGVVNNGMRGTRVPTRIGIKSRMFSAPLRLQAQIFNLGVQSQLIYRWNFLLRVLVGFVPLLGSVYLWNAVFAGHRSFAGYTFHKHGRLFHHADPDRHGDGAE